MTMAMAMITIMIAFRLAEAMIALLTGLVPWR